MMLEYLRETLMSKPNSGFPLTIISCPAILMVQKMVPSILETLSWALSCTLEREPDNGPCSFHLLNPERIWITFISLKARHTMSNDLFCLSESVWHV